MKKIALLSALALCLGFTSCDDNDIIGIPQNPEPSIFETSGLAMTPSTEVTGGTTFDLKAYADEGKDIPLASIALTGFPSDYELQMVMQISKDESFSKITEVPTTFADGALSVSAEDLQSAYYSNISRDPKENTIYARYAGYAVNGLTSVRLGDPEFYWPNGEGGSSVAIKLLPYPSSLVLESAYYLVGTINGWSIADAVPFNHSSESPYDDPVFTLKVDITAEQAAAGWKWNVIPQSTKDAGDWVAAANASYGVAVDGDATAMSGELVARTATENCGTGVINEAGPYLITINLEEKTYDFSLAIDNLWTPGNSNGWSHDSSQMLFTNDYTNYMGYAHLNGDFKFTSQNDWNGIAYGSTGVEGTLSKDGGAGNLAAPADALYYCNVNIATLTYSLYQVTTIGAIGDFNGWAASVALTPSDDFLVWEGDVDFGDGTGTWKLRCNDDWAVNLGGDINSLVQDGANIPAPGAGVHHVLLDLSALSSTGKGYVLYY